MDPNKAIKLINFHGLLLVFPIKNAKQPDSLWSQLYPRSKMVWDWHDDGSNKVHELWHLMKALSSSGKVVYSKWYQGRATFFSKPLFQAMLTLKAKGLERHPLQKRGKLDPLLVSSTANRLFEILQSDSPLSTKELKRFAELQGREMEGLFNAAMKNLFLDLKIVAYGEVDDGSFPSLAVGATELLFEDLCTQAKEMPPTKAQKLIDELLPEGSKFRAFWDRSLN